MSEITEKLKELENISVSKKTGVTGRVLEWVAGKSMFRRLFPDAVRAINLNRSLREQLDGIKRENENLIRESLRICDDTVEIIQKTERQDQLNMVLPRVYEESVQLNHVLRAARFGPSSPCPEPVRRIPEELLPGYTVNGRIPVLYAWGNAAYPNNHPLIYTDEEINAYQEQIGRREWYIYGMVDVWVWNAFEKYPPKGCSVANIGSLTPWYESVCLTYGANPTTIDYNRIISRSKRIRTMTVDEWEKERPQFDFALSISSFEHDGLGMYGDPLDPDGDLKAMQKMKEMVKPGGYLFLALPVGQDAVRFNSARIYGKIRLPILLKGWNMIDSFGYSEELLSSNGDVQPLLILKNESRN